MNNRKIFCIKLVDNYISCKTDNNKFCSEITQNRDILQKKTYLELKNTRPFAGHFLFDVPTDFSSRHFRGIYITSRQSTSVNLSNMI